MRKIFSIVCGLFLVSAVSICAQESVEGQDSSFEQTEQQATEPEGWHPYKEITNYSRDFANWSLTFEGGFNIFDGDFAQTEGSLFPRSLFRPTGAISLTYDFTPTWGLTGLYSFEPYGNFVGKNDSLPVGEVSGKMHTLNLFLNYNLMNAWFPHRQKNIFSLYMLAGLGMGIYHYDYNDEGTIYNPRSEADKYATTGVISVGAAAEFNVGRSVSLGLKGLYQIYTSDKLENKIQGANNDCMEYATLYLRWKINAKRNSHIRNLSSSLYEDIASSKNPQLAGHTRQAKNDTLYISSKDTIFAMPSDSMLHATVEAIVDEKLSKFHPAVVPCYYAYFEIDKYDLTESALQAIQQLAAQLQADTTLCVEVSGFCDNTGSDNYNRTLGQRRTNRVIQELKNIYGISSERVVPNYKGIVKNVDASYSPNRRVEMRLISKEELDSLSQATPIVTTDAVVKEHAVLETVISTKNTSFFRLAKKYYNNGYCWPYIYAANRKVARNDNPDFIFTDVKIVIPQLSQEEINAADTYTVDAMLETIRKQK